MNIFTNSSRAFARTLAVFTALTMVMSAFPVQVMTAFADHDTGEPYQGEVLGKKKDDGTIQKIRICHATDSDTNPYTNPEVNISSFFSSGHDQDNEDIIPPFHYTEGDGVEGFDGMNWDSEGQEIWNNECNVPETTGTIVIEKSTSAEGEEVEFDFTGDLDPFSLNGNDSETFEELDPDTYEVTESDEEGWDLASLTCEVTGDNGSDWDDTDSTVSIDLEAGDTVTCTFSNEEEQEPEPEPDQITISATKIVCPEESMLPNGGFSSIDGDTAADFLTDNEECFLQEDWQFEWALDGITIGDAPSNSGALGDPWTTSGNTDNDGNVTMTISEEDLDEASTISVREVWNDNYIPFTGEGGSDETAEFYCADDAANFDNLEWIQDVSLDSTYHCVGWNVPEEVPQAEIVAHKIVCTDEADLPNNDVAAPFTSSTAQDWVDTHDSCEFAEGWEFEWAGQDEPNPDNDVQNDPLYGEAGGNWTTFGPTDSNGETSAFLDADDIGDDTHIWVREVLQEGFIPFTYGPNNQSNDDDVTAELYCHNDVKNFDNYDRVDGITVEEIYHCIGWNVPEDDGGEEPNQCIPESPAWADEVEESDQGDRKDGSDVPESRSNPEDALGEEDWEPGDTDGFFSLGLGGSIVVSFTGFIPNVDGDDISVHEVTNGQHPLEKAQVEVSQDGSDWHTLTEEARNDNSEGGEDGVTLLDFDETGLDWIKFVRITDTTDPDIHANDGDGFDLDAVDATERVCTEPEPEEPQECSVTIVSDETNTVVEKDDAFAQLLSFIHAEWTAAISGASWIWGDDPVDDPVVGVTQTFEKSFGWNGPITNATLEIASDNTHSATLNGDSAGSDADPDNFHAGTQDSYDVTSLIDQGTNELAIEVTNTEGSTDPAANPAGLLYKLTVTGTDPDCDVPPEEDEGKIVVFKKVINNDEGELSSGDFTLYVDDTEVEHGEINQFPLGEYTITEDEEEGYDHLFTFCKVFNKDGKDDKPKLEWDGPSEWYQNDFNEGNLLDYLNQDTVELDDEKDIAICVVVNDDDRNGGGGGELPACEAPGENLLTNGGFETPEVEHAEGWNIFASGTTGLGWIVEWVSNFAGAPETALLELHGGVNGWLPSSGEQYAELDSDWGGPDDAETGEEASVEISQTVTTVPGVEYTLEWDFSGRPGTGAGDNDLRVKVGGAEVADNSVANGGNQTDWTSDSFTFTATSTQTKIAFADAGDPNSEGTFIDNASLACEAEPNGGGNGEEEELSCEAFTATPNVLDGETEITLEWEVAGDPDTVTIDQGIGDVATSGATTTIVENATTFTLTVMKGEDEVECDVSVTEPQITTTGGGGGGGQRIELSSSGGSRSSGGSNDPEGEVLGDQVSVVPQGAPDTGAGGAAPASTGTATILSIIAVLTLGTIRVARNAK